MTPRAASWASFVMLLCTFSGAAGYAVCLMVGATGPAAGNFARAAVLAGLGGLLTLLAYDASRCPEEAPRPGTRVSPHELRRLWRDAPCRYRDCKTARTHVHDELDGSEVCL